MKIVKPILNNCLIIHEKLKSRILCSELNAVEKYNVLGKVFEAASSPRSCLVRKTKEKMEGQKYIAADVYHHHLLAFT